MTSTSLVQIIDLTGSPSSIHESQSVRKSTDHGADPDPDNYPTPTVRKRRNGELARARSRPVESRGASLERRHVRAEEGTKSQLAEDAQGGNGESTRKKKRRSKKSKDQHKDSPPSRDDTTQHDALSSLHDGQLFFVDVAPATVPAGVVFNPAGGAKDAQPSVQAQASEPDRAPLLLPAHVSVLDPGDDLPVQVIQPADSDSDSGSYIEYLDYDDRLVRLQQRICSHASVPHSV
jgi:protein AIR1/2